MSTVHIRWILGAVVLSSVFGHLWIRRAALANGRPDIAKRMVWTSWGAVLLAVVIAFQSPY